jgi:hypothetical protein
MGCLNAYAKKLFWKGNISGDGLPIGYLTGEVV